MVTISTQNHQRSLPIWITARVIIGAHAEDTWHEMLCKFSSSKIIYRQFNAIILEGLNAASTVALKVFCDCIICDEGTALITELDDFDIAEELRKLLGMGINVECLIVGDLNIKDSDTLEQLAALTECKPGEFYLPLKEWKQ
jgi:hypothetical protein